ADRGCCYRLPLVGLDLGWNPLSWRSGQVAGLLSVTAVLYLALLLIERFVREPLLPLDLFRQRVLAASGLLALLGGMIIYAVIFSLYAVIFYLPLFIQGVLGQAATSSGASLAPLFLSVTISAVLVGQVIAKVGRYHFLGVIGAIILLSVLFLLTCLDVTTVLWTILLDMIIVGLGAGLLQPIYTLAGLNAIS